MAISLKKKGPGEYSPADPYAISRTSGKRGRPVKYGGFNIHSIDGENPYRDGSKSSDLVWEIIDAELADPDAPMTVSVFRSLGGKSQQLDHLLRHNAIELRRGNMVISEPKTNSELKEMDIPEIPETSNAVEPTAEDAPAEEQEDAPAEEQDNKPAEKIIPDCFPLIVALASIRQNILLSGPAGCGKTTIGKLLAKNMGLDFSMISCSDGMSESHLVGKSVPNITNGKERYQPSDFITAFTQGGVFLFDEMDAADANAMVFINAALACEPGESFNVQQSAGATKMVRHENFVCIAAANTLGDGESERYARNKLDAATLDRFRAGIVEVDYDPRIEKPLSDPEVYDWAIKVRGLIERHNLEYIMSTRTLIAFSRQYRKFGFGRDYWERSFLADWTDEDRTLYKEKLDTFGY